MSELKRKSVHGLFELVFKLWIMKNEKKKKKILLVILCLSRWVFVCQPCFLCPTVPAVKACLLGWVWLIDHTVFASQIWDGTILAYYMFFFCHSSQVMCSELQRLCIWGSKYSCLRCNNTWQHFLWKLTRMDSTVDNWCDDMVMGSDF